MAICSSGDQHRLQRLRWSRGDWPHFQGEIRAAQDAVICKIDGSTQPFRVTQLFGFEGLGRTPIEHAAAGDIVALAGVEGINIGETVASAENPKALPPIVVDEPTISMNFAANTSPFAGRDGKFVTGRHVRDRLAKETLGNVRFASSRPRTPMSSKFRAAANYNWPLSSKPCAVKAMSCKSPSPKS
jgi:GTP-binding protein